MAHQAAADVPLLISSHNSSSERRISPSWTIAQLRSRLEPITGVPAASQQLTLRVGSQDAVAISAADEELTQLAAFPLQPYAEIAVSPSSHCFISSDSLPCPRTAKPRRRIASCHIVLLFSILLGDPSQQPTTTLSVLHCCS